MAIRWARQAGEVGARLTGPADYLSHDGVGVKSIFDLISTRHPQGVEWSGVPTPA